MCVGGKRGRGACFWGWRTVAALWRSVLPAWERRLSFLCLSGTKVGQRRAVRNLLLSSSSKFLGKAVLLWSRDNGVCRNEAVRLVGVPVLQEEMGSSWGVFLPAGLNSTESGRTEMYHSGSEESDLVRLSKRAFYYSKSFLSHFPELNLAVPLTLLLCTLWTKRNGSDDRRIGVISAGFKGANHTLPIFLPCCFAWKLVRVTLKMHTVTLLQCAVLGRKRSFTHLVWICEHRCMTTTSRDSG